MGLYQVSQGTGRLPMSWAWRTFVGVSDTHETSAGRRLPEGCPDVGHTLFCAVTELLRTFYQVSTHLIMVGRHGPGASDLRKRR